MIIIKENSENFQKQSKVKNYKSVKTYKLSSKKKMASIIFPNNFARYFLPAKWFLTTWEIIIKTSLKVQKFASHNN